jgi:hypothetical protein
MDYFNINGLLDYTDKRQAVESSLKRGFEGVREKKPTDLSTGCGE